MFKKYRKHLALLFAGSFSVVLAACYGIPVDMKNEVSIKAVTNQNEAIPGLKITMSNNGEHVYDELTNESGFVYYPDITENADNDYQFVIEDVDGELNGGLYLKQVVDITENQKEYTVTMLK
jgi:hypothetical protein